MQSSGVGNCINMFSLLRNCGFAGLLLVTMRGEFGEFNPWQVPMGTISEDALGFAVFSPTGSTAPPMSMTLSVPARHGVRGQLLVAILLSQRLIGRKQWTR